MPGRALDGGDDTTAAALLAVSASDLRRRWRTPALPPARIAVWLLHALLVAGAGCAFFFPTRLTYHRANVTAHGHRDAWSLSGGSFCCIELGTPDRPYRGEPVLTLRFSDGATVRTDRLDAAQLRRRAERITPDPQRRIEQGGWPPGIEELSLGGYRFLVRNGEVLGVFLTTHGDIAPVSPPPEIGDAEANVFHRLPIDRKTLIALLGKPDVLYEDLADPL